MKKLANFPMWPLKVIAVIWLVVANTGCYKIFSHIAASEETEAPYPSFTHEERNRRCRIANELLNNRYDAAKEKVARGGIYTVHDYFRDYADLRLLEDSLQVPRSFMNYKFSYLNQMSHEYILNGHGDELEIARAEFYKKTNDPMAAPRNHEPINWESVRASIAKWLWEQYYKGLFPALMLFFAWFRRSEKKPTNANIISLFCNVLIWPIVVLRKIFRIWIDSMEKANIRSMQENLFSVVTEKEVTAFRNVVRKTGSLSKSLAGFALPVERKHNFAYALMITLLLQIIPQSFLKAETMVEKKTDSKEVIFSKITSHLTNYVLSDSKIASKISSQDDHSVGDAEVLIPPLTPDLPVRHVKIIPWFYYRILQDVHDRIDHIPLAVVSNFSALVNAFTNCFTTKKTHNEKNNYFTYPKPWLSLSLQSAHLCANQFLVR